MAQTRDGVVLLAVETAAVAGRIAGGEVALGFAVGALWTLGFAAIYAISWPVGIRRYQAVAG